VPKRSKKEVPGLKRSERRERGDRVTHPLSQPFPFSHITAYVIFPKPTASSLPFFVAVFDSYWTEGSEISGGNCCHASLLWYGRAARGKNQKNPKGRRTILGVLQATHPLLSNIHIPKTPRRIHSTRVVFMDLKNPYSPEPKRWTA